MARENGMVDCIVTSAVMLVWFVGIAGSILGAIAVDDVLSNALGEQAVTNKLIYFDIVIIISLLLKMVIIL